MHQWTSTCIVRPSFLMRSLPSFVHGAGSSSSRLRRYRQTKKPDLPLSGQYFTTWACKYTDLIIQLILVDSDGLFVSLTSTPCILDSPVTTLTLYIPSYRFPSSGQYLLCLRPLQLRTTLTGLPSFQFFACAPFLSLTGMLQLRASALVVKKKTDYSDILCFE